MSAPLTTESRWTGTREVLTLSGPIILGSMSQTIMEFADRVMVGRVSTDALAAVGGASLWCFTTGSFVFGMLGCVTTFVAQSMGRGERERCASYVWQGIYIALASSLLAVALWLFSGPLFRAMHHAPEVTRLELVYFRIRLFGLVPMALSIVLSSFFQGIYRPMIPMAVGIATNILNVVLNAVLIFGLFGFPKLGVAGAALATVISQVAHACLVLAVYLSGSFAKKYGTRGSLAIDVTRLWELVRIGFPAGLNFFIDLTNWGIFASFIVGRLGSVQLASHTAAIGFVTLSFMPALGVNQGLRAIVGNYLGERDIARARARTYTSLKMVAIYMIFMGFIFGLFGERLMHVFSDNPEVIRMGGTILIFAALFQAFDAVCVVITGALGGAGDTKWMACATFVTSYCIFLPLAYVLTWPLGLGMNGAWASVTIYIMILAGVLALRFRGERWHKTKIFAEDFQAAQEG